MKFSPASDMPTCAPFITTTVEGGPPGAGVQDARDMDGPRFELFSMLAVAAAQGDEAFIIGGAELYAAALPLGDRLQLTEIDAAFEGDTHFPAIDARTWRETARETHQDGAGFAYAFVTYERS